jgi:hypothetical protein
MIFFKHDIIDPLGSPVRLIRDRKHLSFLKRHEKLRIEDKTSNYVRYRSPRSKTRYGYFVNEGD